LNGVLGIDSHLNFERLHLEHPCGRRNRKLLALDLGNSEDFRFPIWLGSRSRAFRRSLGPLEQVDFWRQRQLKLGFVERAATVQRDRGIGSLAWLMCHNLFGYICIQSSFFARGFGHELCLLSQPIPKQRRNAIHTPHRRTVIILHRSVMRLQLKDFDIRCLA
jgi:hypothetical protein